MKLKYLTAEQAQEMADRITSVIYDIGNGRLGKRIAVKSGTYPDKEKDEGGFSRQSFNDTVKLTLTGGDYTMNSNTREDLKAFIEAVKTMAEITIPWHSTEFQDEFMDRASKLIEQLDKDETII